MAALVLGVGWSCLGLEHDIELSGRRFRRPRTPRTQPPVSGHDRDAKNDEYDPGTGGQLAANLGPPRDNGQDALGARQFVVIGHDVFDVDGNEAGIFSEVAFCEDGCAKRFEIIVLQRLNLGLVEVQLLGDLGESDLLFAPRRGEPRAGA